MEVAWSGSAFYGFVHQILVGWRSYLFSSVGYVVLRVPRVQDKNNWLKFECFPSFVAFLFWIISTL